MQVMSRGLTWRVAAGAAALVAVAAAGGAVAATKLSPKKQSQAVVKDAAEQLGVEPSKLDAALRTALEHRVDAAVAAGRLSKEEGDALKERIRSGDVPLFGFGRRHDGFGPPGGFRRHGPFGAKLDAAAKYLGLEKAELRSQLRSGKTLAQVAGNQGKSVDGLVEALVNEAEKKVDAAQERGRLTQAEKQDLLAGLRARITDLVNGRFPPGLHHGGFGPAFGFERPGRGLGRRAWAWPQT